MSRKQKIKFTIIIVVALSYPVAMMMLVSHLTLLQAILGTGLLFAFTLALGVFVQWFMEE